MTADQVSRVHYSVARCVQRDVHHLEVRIGVGTPVTCASKLLDFGQVGLQQVPCDPAATPELTDIEIICRVLPYLVCTTHGVENFRWNSVG